MSTRIQSCAVGDAPCISAVMISCAQRDDVRTETLASLRASDWGCAPVHVEMDCTSFTRLQERQEHTSLAALRGALALGSPHCLFFEDDLIFNRHLLANLTNWLPYRRGKLSLASLYNPNIRRVQVCPAEHWFVADPNAVYGSQAFLLSRELIVDCVTHWWEVTGMQDIKISRLAARMERPIYYHLPSLVQHRPVPSVWGGCRHQANDFSGDWVNPLAQTSVSESFSRFQL